jgi:hypothetical protein
MSRIRTVKPSFWGSGDVARLSRDARLLALGLVSMADDDGRFLAATTAINGYVFPNDDLPNGKVSKWIEELAASGFIHLYTVCGVRYGVMPTWHLHQKINRHTPSILPPPDIDCAPRNSSKDD